AIELGLLKECGETARKCGLGDLWERLINGYSERSPSGGAHLIYRVSGQVPGNTKLACAEDNAVLIETRGEGGFCVVAPSYGTYTVLRGSPSNLPTITVQEQKDLYTLCMQFDQRPKSEPREYTSSDQNRPGDQFNRDASWGDILIPNGWTHVFTRKGVMNWRRPGKEEGTSATTGHGGDWMYVFSSSAGLPTEQSLNKFFVYAHLEHAGDMKAAARELGALGYGETVEKTTDTSSWLPKKLEGLEPPPPADLLTRTDGKKFFYRGRINGLVGESESGKSWIALATAAEEIMACNYVFYIDFEDSAESIYERMRSLGVPLDVIHTYFMYLNPDTQLTEAARDELFGAIKKAKPTLIVVDGFNEAMTMFGHDINSTNDVDQFGQE
ncbi:MAG: AAA family ATPase, partial [Nitrospira sp.]|nr:AAA family ATPase [Nitrospira sp.]